MSSDRPKILWRFRDRGYDDWQYSEVPVNPEKYEYVEVYRLIRSYEDGRRDEYVQ